MKIENLSEGMIVKNYKELCEVLEIKQVTSNSKVAQFKELSLHCEYRKEGHRFYIDKIYDKPKEKIENRGKNPNSRGNNSIYGEIVQLLILDILAQSNRKVSINRTNLLFTIKAINANYQVCGENVTALSVYADIKKETIYDFYNTSKSSFKNIVDTALKNLKDKALITYRLKTMYKDRRNGKHYEANEHDSELIMKVNGRILDELGYEKVSDVMFTKDWKIFKAKSNEIFKQTKIEYYYEAYEIIANGERLEKGLENIKQFLLENDRRLELKYDLNYKVCERMVENAEKRKEPAFGFKEGKIHRADECYVDDIKKLAELLIKPNANNITEEIVRISQKIALGFSSNETKENIKESLDDDIIQIIDLDDLFLKKI